MIARSVKEFDDNEKNEIEERNCLVKVAIGDPRGKSRRGVVNCTKSVG